MELRQGKLANSSPQEFLIDGDNLRYVGDGFLWKTCDARRQTHISRRQSPLEITGKRDTNDGSNAAAVQPVALNHDNRPAEPGTRTGWRRQIRPPNLAL